MDLIFNPIFYGLAEIFAKILNVIVDVCGAICGIPDDKGGSLLTDLLTGDTSRPIYYIFGGLCIVTGLFSLIFAMAENFRARSADGIGTAKPYIGVLKGIAHMFLVSSLFFVAVMLVGEIGRIFSDTLNYDRSIGGTILSGCFDTSSIQDNGPQINDWNEKWANGNIPSWSNLTKIGSVRGTFNVWQALISIGVVTVPMISIAMYLGKRLVNIILLFAVAPISFAMYPTDDGHAKDEWYKDMKGALVGGVVMMIMLYIYLAFMGAIYGRKIVAGDATMNGIFQSLIVGAGVSVLLPLTKQVLKYLGCDDALLATVGSMTPMRAFRAIKRGVTGVAGKFGSKKSSSAGGSDVPQETPAERTAAVQLKAQTIARERTVHNGMGRGSAAGGADRPSMARSTSAPKFRLASKERMRQTVGEGKQLRMKQPTTSSAPKQESASLKTPKRGDRLTETSKGGSVKVPKAKAESNKETERLTTALGKLNKSLKKSFKAYRVDGNGEKKPLKIDKNSTIKTIPTTARPTPPKPRKIERKREVKPVAVKQIKHGNTTVHVENKTQQNVSAKIRTPQRTGDGAVKDTVKRLERKMNENEAKLKRINGNLQSLPRKIGKSLKHKK